MSTDLGIEIPQYETEGDVDQPEAGEQFETDGSDLTVDAEISEVEEALDLIDLDQFGDKLTPITVNGETEYVPLKEAVAGAMRHADYTRKTQLLSDERQANNDLIALGNAIKTNPLETLESLNRFYGVNTASTTSDDDVYQTPEEKALSEQTARLAQLESQLSSMNQRQQIQTDFERLEAVVGPVDRDAVLQHAMNAGTVGNLEATWAHMNIDTISKGREAAAKQAAKQDVVADKRALAGVARASNVSKSSMSGVSDVPTSVTEAANMAEQGITVDASRSLPDWVVQA